MRWLLKTRYSVGALDDAGIVSGVGRGAGGAIGLRGCTPGIPPVTPPVCIGPPYPCAGIVGAGDGARGGGGGLGRGIRPELGGIPPCGAPYPIPSLPPPPPPRPCAVGARTSGLTLLNSAPVACAE